MARQPMQRWNEKAGLRRDAIMLPMETHSKCKRRPAMKKNNTVTKSPRRREINRPTGRITIGMDLGDKISRYCMLDGSGEVVKEGGVSTTKKALAQVFGAMRRCRIAI